MNTVIFETREAQARGLIGIYPIPRDLVFVFPGIRSGSVFTSNGVCEPFDLVFYDAHGNALKRCRMNPPHDVAVAPSGTFYACESAAGMLMR